MGILVATAKATDANSYCTVARADEIMEGRLYTTDWDSASGSTASGFLVNDGGDALQVGDTSIVVDSGSGAWVKGCELTFAGDSTIYTLLNALSSASGTLLISPGLVADPGDDAVITRETLNEKEKALIWTTRLFDEMFIWYGYKRTTTQALRHPRSNLMTRDQEYYDYDIICEPLEIAVTEMGLVLLQRNKFKLPAVLGQGISEAKLGPLSIKIAASEVEEVVPQNIQTILSVIGKLRPEAQTGSMAVPLVRV